jgi:hypothetical protein
MKDPISVIRAIVRDELQALRLGDIGVVTSIFPHKEEGDEHNHACSVKLRDCDIELRKVPIATPHVGMVSAPEVGDLVLISYVGGDANRAVVVGRLYSEKARPPVHEAGEWRVSSPLKGETSIAIDKEKSFVITAGKTLLTVKKDGAIEVQGETDLQIKVKGKASLEGESDLSIKVKGKTSVEGESDLAIKVKGKVNLECTDCKVKASGNIDLGEGGAGVITEASHKCYFTGKPLVPSKTVKAKG